MSATWTKLKSGTWGIRITETGVDAGDVVTVTKKSGESKTVTVEKVIWSGNGVSLATVAPTKKKSNGDRKLNYGGSVGYGSGVEEGYYVRGGETLAIGCSDCSNDGAMCERCLHDYL